MEIRPIVNLTVFLHLLSSTTSTSPMTVLFAMVSTIQLRNLPPKPMKSMIPNISQSVLILTVPLRLSWSSIHRCFPDVCPFAYSSRYLTRNSWKILRMRLDSSQFLDSCVWPDFSESWTSGWCKADEPQVRGSWCALNLHNTGDQTSQNRTALETSEYGNQKLILFVLPCFYCSIPGVCPFCCGNWENNHLLPYCMKSRIPGIHTLSVLRRSLSVPLILLRSCMVTASDL